MSSEVILDLNQDLNARAFEENESFYAQELAKAEQKILDTIKVLKTLEQKNFEGRKKVTSEKNILHFHEALTVLGERGSGKTSFLLSLCRRLEDSENVRLHFLPIVDPTLLENAELILVTVISNIVQKIHKLSIYERDENYENYQKHHQNLARGLRILLGESHLRELASEPEIFAMEALKDAESGAKLAHYFREFCAAALKLLGKDFFVLPIDDIDMMLARGQDVLETIRRYLSNDKMIVLLSGHFELYRYITKLFFFKQLFTDESNLPENLPEIFENEQERILLLLDDLTTQYLLKIMPAYNRIELPGVNRKLWRKEIIVQIKGKILLSFEKLWRLFCEEFFFCPSTFEEKFLNPREWPPAVLIPFSARGFVNFIKILTEHYLPEDRFWEPEKLYRNLLWVFISNFLKLDMEDLYRELRVLPESEHLGALAAVIYRNRYSLGLNYWLLDPPGDPYDREGEDLQQIYLLIQLGIHIAFKRRPLLILDTITRLGITFEIVNSYEPLIDPEEISGDIYEILEDERSEFVVKGLSTNDIREAVGYLTGRLPLKPPNWWYGLLFLTKRRQRYGKSKIFNTMVPFVSVSKKEDFYSKPYTLHFLKTLLHKKPEARERILQENENNVKLLESPDLFPAVKEWESRVDETGRWLLYFFSVLYYPFKAEFGSFWTVSIFTALANLQRLLEKELPEEEEELREALKLDLPYFPLEGAIEEEVEGEEEEREEPNENYPRPSSEWARVIRAWWAWAREELRKEETLLPAPVLSRAIHRLYDNLRALKDELAPWERSLGFVVSRWILAFWQALVMEEVAFRSGRREYLRRIIREAGLFEKKEEKKEEKREKKQEKLNEYLSQSRLAKIFIYCPILLGLVEDNIRSRLLKREDAPEFVRNFNFMINYRFRDQKLRAALGLQDVSLDLYTVFCALTASVPPARAKTDIDKGTFLKDLAQHLAKVIK